MLARASTKTFVSRVRKTAKKIFVIRKIRYQCRSLAEVSLYVCQCMYAGPVLKFSRVLNVVLIFLSKNDWPFCLSAVETGHKYTYKFHETFLFVCLSVIAL